MMNARYSTTISPLLRFQPCNQKKVFVTYLTLHFPVREMRPRRVRRALLRARAVLRGRRHGLPAAGAGGGDGGVPEGGGGALPLPQRRGEAVRRRRVGPVRLHGPLLQRKW